MKITVRPTRNAVNSLVCRGIVMGNITVEVSIARNHTAR